MNKLILQCCLLLLMSSTCLAQNTTLNHEKELKGVVLDKATHSPIPYATIIAVGVKTDKPQGTVSDDNGVFRLIVDTVFNQKLHIQCVGYQSIDVDKFVYGKMSTLEILLEQDVKNLQEVQVVARKKLIKLSNKGLTYDLKNDVAAKSESVLKALRRVPLVTVDGEGSIQVKGTSNYSIYLNGKPFKIADQNPGQVLEGIAAADVERVEVITKPDASYCSDVAQTVINIVTYNKRIKGYSLQLSTQTNTRPKHNSSISYSFMTEKLKISAQYNYDMDKQPKQPIHQERTITQENGLGSLLTTRGESSGKVSNHTGHLMMELELDTLNTIYADGHVQLFSTNYTVAWNKQLNMSGIIQSNSFNSKNDFSQGAVEGNVIYRNLRKTDKQERFSVGYRYSYSPDNRSSESINVADMTSLRKSQSKGGMNEHTLSFDALVYQNNNWLVKSGANAVLRDSKATLTYNYPQAGNGNVCETKEDFYRQKHQHVAVYLTSTYAFGRSSINAGLRAEHTSYQNKLANGIQEERERYTSLYPQISFTNQLSDNTQWDLSYSYRIQRPSIWLLNPYKEAVDEYTMSYGNPLLNIQHNHQAAVSIMNSGNKYFVYMSLDYHYYRNPIYQNLFAQPNDVQTLYQTYENGKSLNSLALNLSVNYRPTTVLSMNINLSATRYWFRRENYDLQKEFSYRAVGSVDYQLPHNWNLESNISYAQAEPSFGVNYRHSLRYSFFASKTFWRDRMTVTLQVNDPFHKYSQFQATEWGKNFTQVRQNDIAAQAIGLRLNYRISSGKNATVKRNQSLKTSDLDRTTGVR